MRQFGGLFWFVLVMATGIANFAVKQTVQNLEDELGGVRKKTVAEQKEIHELTADWTFLNQPELLADLNRRYVGLVPMAPKQVVASIAAIPLRPAPPADAAAPSETGPPAGAIPLETVSLAAEPVPSAPLPAAPAPAVAAARAAPAPAATAAAPAARPATVASLDALFAQVAGDR